MQPDLRKGSASQKARRGDQAAHQTTTQFTPQRCAANTDANTDTNTDANTDTNTDTNTDANTVTNTDTNADTNTDQTRRRMADHQIIEIGGDGRPTRREDRATQLLISETASLANLDRNTKGNPERNTKGRCSSTQLKDEPRCFAVARPGWLVGALAD